MISLELIVSQGHQTPISKTVHLFPRTRFCVYGPFPMLGISFGVIN